MGLGRVSTGISGLDKTIDMLRLGDNVVWQVENMEEYRRVLQPYAKQALNEGRTFVYIRFSKGEPVLEENEKIHICTVDPLCGFESFATRIHHIITTYGNRAFYGFDCLTYLLDSWYSDLMIMNFFKVISPYLHELQTVSYFSLIRNAHTFNTIAGIRETTRLLLDIYSIDKEMYVHPLKVCQRYSPTMFFPHHIK